jgi:hypothetical protein
MEIKKFDILFEEIISKLSNNSINEAKQNVEDPYHFDIGDKTFTVIELKFEDFNKMIDVLKEEGYKVTNPRKNAYRIRKAKETDAWKLWNEIKKNHPDWYDQYTFGVYANRFSNC